MKNEKLTYETPALEIISFETEDVITTSGIDDETTTLITSLTDPEDEPGSIVTTGSSDNYSAVTGVDHNLN